MTSLRNSLFALLIAVIGVVRGEGLIDCYYFNGDVSHNNTRCPGSNTCCGPQATCLSNGLCHNAKDGENTFVRGPCAKKPYDKNSCAQICLYDETDGVFPRVTLCGDGSLCCDNDPQCCGNGKGIFLDNRGHVAKSRPSTTYSWGPERTAATFRTTLPSATHTSPSSAPTQSPDKPKSSDKNDNNQGVKIGLGVGIPVGCIAIGAVAFLLFRRRRKSTQATSAELGTEGTEGEKKTVYGGPPVTSGQPQVVSELDGSANQVRSELPA